MIYQLGQQISINKKSGHKSHFFPGDTTKVQPATSVAISMANRSSELPEWNRIYRITWPRPPIEKPRLTQLQSVPFDAKQSLTVACKTVVTILVEPQAVKQFDDAACLGRNWSCTTSLFFQEYIAICVFGQIGEVLCWEIALRDFNRNFLSANHRRVSRVDGERRNRRCN